MKDAIESVFCQTIPPLEIIVVDDGSVPALDLSAYLPRIKLIRTDNKGVSAARNAGAAAAKGRYLAFLDSDDLWLPPKLELQMGCMQAGNADACHSDEFWLRKGRWVNQGKQHAKYGGDILCQILDKCRISPSSTVISSELFHKLGGYDESLRVCEDYELCLRIAAHTKIAYLDKKLIVKRAIDENSLSASIKHIESIRFRILERFAASRDYAARYMPCITAELERKRGIVTFVNTD